MKHLDRYGWDAIPTYTVPGFVDAVAVHRQTNRVILCEFKMPEGKPTVAQQRLIDRGWPIVYLRSESDVLRLEP